jgi:hypothetical protein
LDTNERTSLFIRKKASYRLPLRHSVVFGCLALACSTMIATPAVMAGNSIGGKTTAKTITAPAQRPEKSLQQMLDEFDGGTYQPANKRATRPSYSQGMTYGHRAAMPNVRTAARSPAMMMPAGNRSSAMLQKLRNQIMSMRQGQQPLMNMMQPWVCVVAQQPADRLK